MALLQPSLPAFSKARKSGYHQIIDFLQNGLEQAAEGEEGQTDNPHAKYQKDPVGFCEEVLGETLTSDVKTMMESVRDNIITIARSANATGKTHGAARVATWFYKAFHQSQVYTAAAPPEGNLRRLLWGEIGRITEDHPLIFADDTLTSLNIARSKNEFITGVTIPMSGSSEQREARFSGKHAPHLLFIIDEGDAVPEEVYRGIESCMSGGHIRLLIMFNPRAKSGSVYRKEQSREGHVVHLSAINHPNVLTGENLIPGAVDRPTTLRRINDWTRPLAPAEDPDPFCFEVPDFLVGQTTIARNGDTYPPLPAGYRKIIDPSFSYMVLGEYPAQDVYQLISEEWYNDARTRYDAYVARFGELPPRRVRPILGLDVAEFGKDYNVACPRYGGFVGNMESWGGVDTDETALKAFDLCAKWSPMALMVDATGIGSGVGPRVRRLIQARATAATREKFPRIIESVKVAVSPTFEVPDLGTFGIMRDQLWWSLREWLRTDVGAMLPPGEELRDELLTPTYAIVGNNIKVMDKDEMKKRLGRSPNFADALCLTFYPVRQTKVLFA